MPHLSFEINRHIPDTTKVALGYRPPAPEAIQLHQPTIEAVNAVQ